jgi:parallel beta-helix repeat protein
LKRFSYTVFLLAALTQNASARIVAVNTWPQLLAACQTALPNDTIVIAAGTYTITGVSRIMIDNRPGPVLVKGATGRRADVVIEGQGQDNASVEMVFNLDNSPDWTFRDLTTRNSYYHGFKFDHASTGCRLINVVMRDHGESGVKGTSDPTAGTYPDRLIVDSCDIGFSTVTGGTRTVVEGVDGVGVNDWIIRRTRFVNVQRSGNPAYAVFTKGNSSNTIIEACRFENCFIGASFGGGGTAVQYFRDNNTTYEHRNGIIRNNLIIDCDDAGIYINKGHDCKVYNNTLFHCILTIQLRYTESVGWIRNNLVVLSPHNPGEPIVRLRNGAATYAAQTNVAGAETDFVCGTAAAAQLDLHLAPGSPRIDVGTNVGADVATDYDGGARPFGTAYDIGADEYGVVPIELELFTAGRMPGGVRLRWSTQSETANARFDVLRTDAHGTTCHVGSVPGHGTVDQHCGYELLDLNAPADELRYRLLQTDFDGTERLAGDVVCAAVCKETTPRLLQLWPNPASTELAIAVRCEAGVPEEIEMIDIMGRAVRRLTIVPDASGYAMRTIDVAGIPTGTYALRLTAGGGWIGKVSVRH